MITNHLIHCNPALRHDFMFLIDVSDGNPNGDPDSDNHPRIDLQTMHGLISDVCVKRKIRDAIEQMVGQETGYRIFINADGVPLNTLLREGAIAVQGGKKTEAEELLSLEPVPVATGETEARAKRVSGKKKPNGDGLSAEKRREQADARCRYMCEHFYDIRGFGAVMSTGDYPAGQVHGPIQFTWSRSIDPIMPLDVSITRVAITKEGEDKLTTSTMGRKWIIPYGLYRGYGYFSPAHAQESGFSAKDLTLFWEALIHVWGNDHSAARGRLGLHGLYVFSHNNARGNAPDHELFDHIQVQRRDGIQYPRSIHDYEIVVRELDMPAGVTLTKLVG